MSNRMSALEYQPITASGEVLPGAQLQTYFSQTTTPITTFQDSALTIPHTNPIVADAAGRFPEIFLSISEHRMVLSDADDVQIMVFDPVSRVEQVGLPSGNIVETQTASAGQTVFALANAYITGINGIGVYINGVLQHSPDNYTETSSTSITFTAGLQAGDEITVVIPISSVPGALSSNLILYTQGSAGSLSRTVQNRLQQRIDANDFGAAGDGVTDDTTALTNAVAAAVATNAPLHLVPEATYLFSQLSLPANLVLITHGAVFRADGSVTGSSVLLTFGAGTRADSINVSVPAATSDRTVLFNADCIIGEVQIAADSQINNRNDILDGSVQIRGDNVRIGTIKVDSFDNAVVYFGNITPINGVQVQNTQITNYVRGVLVRNISNAFLGDVYCRLASVNATTDPGHNGILFGSAVNIGFGDAIIDNSGEHAVRVGGQNGVEQDSENIHFGSIVALRPGQTAFKVLGNAPTEIISGISVGKIYSVDCAATTATGTNEDCVQIHNANNIEIGAIHAAFDAKANCANDVLYLAGVRNVNVGTVLGQVPLRFGIVITDKLQVDVLDVAVNTRGCENITLNNVLIVGPGTDGIRIEHGTETPRHWHVRTFYIASPTANGVNISALAAPAQPIRLDGYVVSPGASSYVNAGSSTLVYPTVESNTLDQTFGGFTPTTDFRNLFEQKSVFDNLSVVNEVLFLRANGTNAQGNYGASIGFSDVGASNRRRAAIAAVQTGASGPQTGLEFWVRTVSTSGSDALNRNVRIDHNGSTYPGISDNVQELGQASLRWANTFSTNFNPGAGTVIWTSGAGSPEGSVTANVGSLYTNTSGGAGTTLFVKESGSGNTGWIGK